MNADSEFWRYLVAALVGVLAFQGALWLVGRLAKPVPAQAAFSLDQTLSDIKTELLKVETAPGAPLGLALTEVTVELQLQQATTASLGAGLSVPVFDAATVKAGQSFSNEAGSKVTIKLAPPVDLGLLNAPVPAALKFADLLLAARESLRRAMANEPRLAAKSIEIELSFVLVRESASSADVKVQLLSLEMGGSRKATVGNTVTLTYENPAYAEKASARPIAP